MTSIACVRCQADIEVPDPEHWDVTTQKVDGKPVIVERHYAAVCPACGFVCDHYDDEPSKTNIVSEPVDPPIPFEEG